MTYNTTPRRRFTKAQREAFLILHNYTCYWCLLPIEGGQPWDIEHVVPRELLPGKEADDDGNLRPIHAHPMICHKQKSKADKAAIAKSNRIRRNLDPETRRQTRHKIKSVKRPWPKRSFPAAR